MNTIVYIALSILFFGCTFACGYCCAVKSHMEYGIKVIDSAELVSISITLVPSSAEYYVSRKETRND